MCITNNNSKHICKISHHCSSDKKIKALNRIICAEGFLTAHLFKIRTRWLKEDGCVALLFFKLLLAPSWQEIRSQVQLK